jgi:hypothetical protein
VKVEVQSYLHLLRSITVPYTRSSRVHLLRSTRKKESHTVAKETYSRYKMVLESANTMCSGNTSIGHPPPSESQTYFPSFWNCGGPFPQGDGNGNGNGSSMQTTDDSSISGSISASTYVPPPRTVRSVVNGIISPFINCVQPPLHSTCGAPTMSWEPPRGGGGHQPPSSLVSPDRVYRGSEVRLSSQQPQLEIVQPHLTDILCGRGGSSSRHTGNLHFRELIAANKVRYSTLTKKQKMMLAREIVDLIHSADPPGRFRARDMQTGYWCDIGLPRSLEKTSQALREKPSSSSINVATRPTSPISDIMDSTDMEDQPESIDSVPSDVSDQHTLATQATMSTIAAGNESGNTNIFSKSSRNMQAPPITIPSHLKAVYAPRNTRHEITATTASPETYPQIPRLQEMSPYPGSFHHRAQMFLPFRESPRAQAQAQAQEQEQAHQDDHGHLHPTSFYADAFEVSWPAEPPMFVYGEASPHPPPPGFTRSSGRSGAGTGVMNGPASIMREKSDISPARQQEWKRQRISSSPRSAAFDGTTHNKKNNNESSQLEFAIESQLSLEERVIRPLGSPGRPLTSPAALQQGRIRFRSRQGTMSKGDSIQKAEATADLDGLAALSTAAFLRLDESH